jgi:hypothetical protein
MRRTSTPRLASREEVAKPPKPAPMTVTSYLFFSKRSAVMIAMMQLIVFVDNQFFHRQHFF